MANTNQIAINWSNQKVRVLADRIHSLYLTCKNFKQMADSQTIYGAANPIPNDATLIADGSGAAGDGRPSITDVQATNLYNRAVDIINWYEGSVGINTSDRSNSVMNTVLNVAVNPAASF